MNAAQVRRYLKGAPVVGARVLRRSKLDPYKAYLMQRFYDDHYDNGRELWREIQAQGYTGGYNAVIHFLAQLRFEKGGLELTGRPLTKGVRPLAFSLPASATNPM
jgi:hypothetical protein